MKVLGSVRPAQGQSGLVGWWKFNFNAIPAFWFARSTEYGSAENLYTPYADSVWVRSAIQKIAQPISSCELLFSLPTTKTVRRKTAHLKQLSTARGIVYRTEEELLDLPQLAEWLKEPVKENRG